MNRPPERFRLTYHLSCLPGEDPAVKAQDIALEQTVELPEACVPPVVRERMVGAVETLEPIGKARWRAVITYPEATVGTEILKYLDLVFGNISLKTGIRVVEVEVPTALMARCGGPRLGIEGLRARCGDVGDRPLLCAAVKPMGLSAKELAELCFAFAAGGMDIVKDDHGLANQLSAPFEERVARCQDAVQRANARTGGHTLYFPNVARGGSAIESQLEVVRACGGQGVLVSPLLLGLEAVQEVAQRWEMALLGHPALAGAFFHPHHGIAPEVLLGRIFRLIGCDGVIYPNVGGRFSFTSEACDAINANLRGPWSTLKRSCPVPAGGIDVERVPDWVDRYGPDTMFLIGSSLYAQSDIRAASERLLKSVKRQCDALR